MVETPQADHPANQREALRRRLYSRRWTLRTDANSCAEFNMAADLSLLDAAAGEEIGPTLRFYAWNPPAVSIGRFQNLDGINVEAIKRRGWDLVRRPTGGLAVLHQHELTYSIVLPPSVVGNVGVKTSHAVLTGLLNAGIRQLLPENSKLVPPPSCDPRANRTPNCFALTGECDTVTSAGKLVGSAQARKGGALLQHGSILLDADRDAWSEIFGEAGRLVTLRELLGRDVAREEVEDVIYRSLHEFFICDVLLTKDANRLDSLGWHIWGKT